MKYQGSCHCGRIADPKGNDTAAVNVRCLEGVDIDKLPVQHFDGRSR